MSTTRGRTPDQADPADHADGFDGSDAFDELAAMFLTNDPQADSSPIGPLRRSSSVSARTVAGSNTAFIQLLSIGHLPVRGNLWLTPYVDAVAREIGPVALIRLDGDQPTLELLRGREEWRAEVAGRPLREVLETIAADIRAWIIRPPASAETAELLEIGFDRIMLLTSADQAAGVAAYQTIKELKLTADEINVELPSLVVTVVGCAAEIATGMVRRLQHTAMSQLGIGVELERVLPRIDSDLRSSVYLRFGDDVPGSMRELIDMIDDATHSAERHSVTPRPLPEREPSLAQVEAPTEAHAGANGKRHAVPSAEPQRVEWDPIVRGEPATRVGRDRDANAVARSETPRIKLGPKPSTAARSKSEASDSPSERLTDHVRGLTALSVRCPHSEHVELAVDSLGGLHLLARESHLREIGIVESWAKSHRELLVMALPDHGIDPSQRLTSHVFTDQPSSVADLHGTDLKLHVLAPVEVEGRRGWYAAALNG
jgi:hypothetical protein